MSNIAHLNIKLEEFQQLLEFLPDAKVLIGPDGRIVAVNEQAARLFGYSKEELLHQPIETLIPRRFLDAHRRNRSDYMHNPHKRPMGIGLDLHARRKDNSEFPVEISLGPIPTTDGTYVISTIRDISERKRVERRFQRLLELAPDALVTVDQAGRITFVNSQAEGMFGYKKEELLGQTIEVLVPHRFRHMHVGQREGYMKDPHLRPMGVGLELFARGKNGNEFPVEISLGPMETDEGTFVMAVIRDVSERKRIESALRKAQAERELLEVSEKTQQKIGQDLHDDLGQHLTAVTYVAQLLQKKLSAKKLSGAKEAAEILKLTSEAINQVRGLARGLYPVELKANGLLPALLELADGTGKKYGLSCVVQSDSSNHVWPDEVAIQLYRIAQEAVNNAVKHAKPKRVVLQLGKTDEKSFLSVRDDGAGMPKTAHGKGMGLHIMKYRADMIGASLEVGPNGTGGTAVTCTLSHNDKKGQNARS